MSKASIVGGVWQRRVTWEKDGVWRTDMFKSVLADDRLEIAEFLLKDGPTIRVSKKELDRVLLDGPEHYHGQIWGPFDIDPHAKRVAGQKVEMHVFG